MVVIGGIGTIEGPFVGLIVYFVLREFLADYGTIYLILMGAIAIGVMLLAPAGIWGFVVQRHGVQLFPIQRRLVLDSEVRERSSPAAPADLGAAAGLAATNRRPSSSTPRLLKAAELRPVLRAPVRPAT